MILRMILASCTAENNIMGIIAPVGNTQQIENFLSAENGNSYPKLKHFC
jgi:hypothetical protein